MNTRKIGTQKEQAAKEYLEGRGMKILEMNYRAGKGEIDIIGLHERYLVFVEVKYRNSQRMGNASEAVTLSKQKQICRVADHYRYTHHYPEETCVRYDVVSIQGERIDWIQNAFYHTGRYF